MSISNSITRVIVAALAIPLILAVCYLGKYYFLLFVLGIALISWRVGRVRLPSDSVQFGNRLRGCDDQAALEIGDY